MKTLEVAVLRIYIPDDDAHLDRVINAIEEFRPSGDVNIFTIRSAFDKSGLRLPSPQKSLMIEFFEESCRAQIFMDALHEDIKPCSVMGSFVFMCEGETQDEVEEREAIKRAGGTPS